MAIDGTLYGHQSLMNNDRRRTTTTMVRESAGSGFETPEAHEHAGQEAAPASVDPLRDTFRC